MGFGMTLEVRGGSLGDSRYWEEPIGGVSAVKICEKGTVKISIRTRFEVTCKKIDI